MGLLFYELEFYSRLFDKNFADLPEDEIESTDYVVSTSEAVLWCLLNSDSYKSLVLKAVNLGGDTDTIAAIAGRLAVIIKKFFQKFIFLLTSLCKHFINEVII